MLCVDTSFLYSLYSDDAHTADAHERMRRHAQPLSLSALNEFEFGNALRLAEYRGLLTDGEAGRIMEALAEDQAAGRWQPSELPLSEIVAEAGRISTTHTVTGGHRAFDILHVAHARLVKPRLFLSFDTQQLALAKALGLRC